jgi:ribosome-binding factor A
MQVVKRDDLDVPTKRYPRTARLNEVVQEVVASELERLSDPRLEMVTITGVDVKADLSTATVYYSALNSDPDGAAKALAKAAPHLRGVLGNGMRVRQVPELVFRPDPAIETGARIDQILREGGRRTDTLDDDSL